VARAHKKLALVSPQRAEGVAMKAFSCFREESQDPLVQTERARRRLRKFAEP